MASSIELTGPVIHIVTAIGLGLLFRLNILVITLCAIFPDLIDKPLSAFGVGGGRYVGHSLLFAVVIITGLFFWKRKFGFAALLGFGSHLLLDLNTTVPWLFPFVEYEISDRKFDFLLWMKKYTSLSELDYELLISVPVVIIALIGRFLIQRYMRQRNSKIE